MRFKYFENLQYKIGHSSLLKSTTYIFTSTLIDSIVRFLIVMILTRYYSKEEYGIWASINSIGAILVTGDFGITNALRNKVSSLLVFGGNGETMQKYFYSVLYFFLFISLVFTCVLLLSFNFIDLDFLFKTDNEILRNTGTRILIFVQIIFLWTIPLSVAPPLFFSYNESDKIAKINIFRSICLLISIIILILINASITLISLSNFIIILLFSAISSLIFIYKHKWFNYKVSLKEIIRLNKELIKVGVKFMTLQLSSSYMQNVGTIIAGSFLSLSLAADYNIYMKIYTFIIQLIQSIFNPIWGRFSSAYFKRDKEWINQAYRKLKISITSAFILSSLILTFIGNYLISFIAGTTYNTSGTIYFMLGISSMAYILFNLASTLPNATNKLNILLTTSIISCFMVTITTKWLSGNLGIIGIPIITALFWFFNYLIMNKVTKEIINDIK